MKRMTSEIIANLQKCIDKYGDLPFSLKDYDNAYKFFDVTVYVDTVENEGCEEGETPTIGIYF